MIRAGVSSSKSVDGRDAVERADNLCALQLRRNRPSFSLVATHRRVGVQADNQHIPERRRLPQVAHVPGMEQVEDAVREDNRPSRGADLCGVRGRLGAVHQPRA